MKRALLIFVLTMAVVGAGFAQNNTITVDIGPTIIGGAFGLMGSILGGGEVGVETSGFGIAVQYERQLMEELSVGARFAYLGVGMGMSDTNDDLTSKYTMDIKSFCIEGHVRFYPGGDAFFVDGMLGYANLAVGFNGNYGYFDENDVHQTAKLSFTAPRDYIKLGAKIGWRINFSNNGGFVFEPSFGWDFGFGISDTIGQSLSKEIKKVSGGNANITELDEMFGMLENYLFIGGPRISLAFGWSF